MPELNITYATFQQTTGNQRLSRVNSFAIHLLDVSRLAADIERIGCVVLHSKGQLEGLNSRVESLIDPLSSMFRIQSSQQIQLSSLRLRRNLWMFDVFNEAAQFFML